MNEVVELYEQGLSRKEIADRLEISYGVVCRKLRDAGRGRVETNEEQVLELNEQGYSQKKISKIVGCSRSRVCQILNKHGISCADENKKRQEERQEQVLELNEQGLTQDEISEIVGCSRQRVSEILRKHGISCADENKKRQEERQEQVLELNEQGLTQDEISEIVGCHLSTVGRSLHKHGICRVKVNEKQILELNEQGLTGKEISGRLGISQSPVSRILCKHGFRKNFYDPEETFKNNTEVVDGYLKWTGYVTHQGYGVMRFNGKKIPVHQFPMQEALAASKYSEELWKMPTDEDLVRHMIDDRLCVDTRFLRIGTHSDNQWDRRYVADEYTTILLYDDDWEDVCAELDIPIEFAIACREGEANSDVFRYVYPRRQYRTVKDPKRFCVYVYAELDGTVRYVGEGTISRIWDHTSQQSLKIDTRFYNWLREVYPNNYQRYKVKTGLTKQESLGLEAELIEKHKETVFNREALCEANG